MGTTPRAFPGLPAAVLLGLAACGGDSTKPPPPPSPLVILTESLRSGAVHQLYTDGIDAEGGDGGHYWELLSGSLPPGVDLAIEDLSDDDLVVTGVPEVPGTFTFTVRVITESRLQADTAQLTIQILPPTTTLRIDNIALPPTAANGQVGIPLRASGDGAGSFSWSLVAGALPAGLELQSSGVISGVALSPGESSFTVEASSGGESAFRSFTLRVVPNDVTRFNLTIFELARIPADIRPHVAAAVARWEAAVTGDLEGGVIPSAFFDMRGCGGMGAEANGAAVDDVLVMVNIDSIDGPGKVLGQAGPCAIRQNGLPFIGVVTLDAADLTPLVGTTTLTSIIAHEIGHVLGFGTLWTHAGLLVGAGTEDPRFTGPLATGQWQALGGTGAVPVENQGGQGTVGSHLRESVFGHELMTGFSAPVGVPQPLSRVSIASLADLGFAVDLGAADPFTLAAGLVAHEEGAAGALGWDRAGVGPVRVAPGFGGRAEGRAP
ncbi:MAG TPA: putative Ig domain-containing protein [Longimicrobiales bacterium]|nr:putative Ig domain-containing protein [Longimicrobiales bacterium]